MSKKRKRSTGRRPTLDLTQVNFDATTEPKVLHSEAIKTLLENLQK